VQTSSLCLARELAVPPVRSRWQRQHSCEGFTSGASAGRRLSSSGQRLPPHSLPALKTLAQVLLCTPQGVPEAHRQGFLQPFPACSNRVGRVRRLLLHEHIKTALRPALADHEAASPPCPFGAPRTSCTNSLDTLNTRGSERRQKTGVKTRETQRSQHRMGGASGNPIRPLDPHRTSSCRNFSETHIRSRNAALAHAN